LQAVVENEGEGQQYPYIRRPDEFGVLPPLGIAEIESYQSTAIDRFQIHREILLSARYREEFATGPP